MLDLVRLTAPRVADRLRYASLGVVVIAGLVGVGPATRAAACGGCSLAAADGPAKRPPRRRITLDLQDAEVRNVIRLIAEVSQLNIVVGDDVEGKVTLKLRDVPWDQALDVVLKAKGLGMAWEGDNIVRVAPQALLDEERRRRLDAAADCRTSAPLKTRTIQVNHARAADLVPIVKDTLSARGRVTYDERTNVLIVKDVDCR